MEHVALPPQESCTGCEACLNICPADAISMREAAGGFLYPAIDQEKCCKCNLCVSTCPVLEPLMDNTDNPKCYAFRAADDIRFRSSSGGLFSWLAAFALADEGHVAGAIFNERQEVIHIVSDKPAEINKMRGSKYVQSRIGTLYGEIRSLLETDKKVLFTGTPCQVAGLRAYLGKPYSNLFLVDLVCHGVPSQRMFLSYLAEVAPLPSIRVPRFRDKTYGWRQYQFTTVMNDGKIVADKDRVYITAYSAHLLQRPACLDCSFSGFVRQGDVTMGDFWGFDHLEEGDNDQDGTSLLLINNQKGEEILSFLRNTDNFLKEVSTNHYRDYNRFWKRLKSEPARQRFFDISGRIPFKKAVKMCQKKIYHIGLVGPYTNKNFGGFMTYYALYKTLCDMGYSVLMIDFPTDAPWGGANREFGSFLEHELYPQYDRAPLYKSCNEMKALNSQCEMFIVGSDQIFRPDFFLGWGKVFQLHWVDDNKKKIAYSSSMGRGGFNCPEGLRLEMSYYLNKFSGFSVREDEGVEICANELGLPAVQTVDPIFLCAKKHYEEIIESSREENEQDKWLFAYLLAPDTHRDVLVQDIASNYNLSSRIYDERNVKDKVFEGNIIKTATLNMWIRDLYDSEFVVTDSFHGLAFSIYFRKDFIVLPNNKIDDPRITSLLAATRLEDRYVLSFSDFADRRSYLLAPIDYDNVYENFQPIIDASRGWLESKLKSSYIPHVSPAERFFRFQIQELKNDFNRVMKAREQTMVRALEEAVKILKEQK